MLHQNTREQNVFKNIFDKVYASKTVMCQNKRQKVTDPEATAAEYADAIKICTNALRADPCDYQALLELKKLLFPYKAFYARQKRRIHGKKNKPKKLLAIFKQAAPHKLTALIADSEYALYEKYFEENPMLVRPKLSDVISTKSFYKRLKNETVFDICKSLKLKSSLIKLKIEQGLLENPKELYPAARALKRHFIIHTGTTNTGKTYNAMKALKAADTGAYLGPLRLLALEIQDELLMADVMCNLKTGEEENIVPYASHIASTVEMADLYTLYDVVVIDECQLIDDEYRGCAWTRAILGVRAAEIHLCTAPEAVDILIKIIEDCGDTYEIKRYERLTPLTYDSSLDTDAEIQWKNERGVPKKPPFEERMKKIDISKLQYGDALIAFSRDDVLQIAEYLRSTGIEPSVIYGALPYDARKYQLKRFINRETSVVVATDAIGMGLNLPIKRVIFTSIYKFDGRRYRALYPSEIKQIAGRAGRRGIYDEGLVYSVAEPAYVENSLTSEIAPIEKAYIDFDTAFVELDSNLEDILNTWSTAKLPFDIYHKINIERRVKLLRHIDNLCTEHGFSCTKETAYKLASIAFDDKEKFLWYRWLGYVKAYLSGDDELKFPRIRKTSLIKLEISFKEVDIYYSFCRTMGYAADLEQIRNTKLYIADEINYRLKNS